LQPILGDLPLHALHVPGKSAAEIAAASRKSEAALGAARSHAVGAANRATLTIRNLIRHRWRGQRLALGIRLHRRGLYFDLYILLRNRNRLRLDFGNYRL